MNSPIYQIDPAAWLDTDGDGWGDLRGVAERLEHVRDLGARSVWLLPFYATAYRDGGYDVTDHRAIDPRFGDLDDFRHLIDVGRRLELRILVELVAQHTSVEHPWFQEARHDRTSPFRDFYIWSDEPVASDVKPIFPTEEESVWEWDEEAQQFYRHVFYHHEPDLRTGHPQVREQIRRTMQYWLDLGVSGFRVDAVPHIVEQARAARPEKDGLWILEEMRDVVRRHGDAILMGEVDVPPDEYDDYLGSDDRLTMLLDFWKNNHVFLALARGEAEPLERAIKEQPTPYGSGHMAIFLRNHDELDLEQLAEDERAQVMDVFAPREEQRIYGRGIRRRLAPMLGNDPDRIAMAHALAMGMHGSPVVLYGDEIGMDDDLDRPERFSMRTPMRWDVADRQRDDGSSLLARIRAMLAVRAGSPEIGFGTCTTLDVGAPSVLALRHEHEGAVTLTAVNLADEPVTCTLSGVGPGDFVEVLNDSTPEADPEADSVDAGRSTTLSETVRLNAHGYRWFRTRRSG